MKKILSKYWPILLVFGLSFLITWPLFKYGYFSHQDDLQVIRIFEMRKCFVDMQIPCRWVPDMGWGNGFPLFNFYGVFPYYLGAILSYLLGFIGASKMLFYISLTLGSLGIYFLVKSLWGKFAGVTSAILYLFAPYKALDVYVRGALAESLALAIIPFVFYFGYKLITFPKSKKYNILFIVSLFIFLTTHNIMVILFAPFLLLWLIYWLAENKWKNVKSIALSGLLAFGMASFFLVPAFFEKNLVQTESLLRFELDFRANYLKLSQLFFDRVWGYGTSIPGPEGGMNFQVGWPYWWLVAVSVLFLFFSKIKRNVKILVAGIITTFIFSVFMAHNKSTFIWINIPLLKYFQFPWRFLSLSIFTASLLGGFAVAFFKDRLRICMAATIIVLTVILNWNYFKPKTFYSISDSEKLSGEFWQEQRRGAILDYLPKTALEPMEAAQESPIVRSGNSEISNFINRSNRWEFDVGVKDKSEIEIPIYYFPNWEVLVDGKKHPFSYSNLLGRITLELDRGDYRVEGRFKDTFIRKVANIITILSAVGFIYYVNRKN